MTVVEKLGEDRWREYRDFRLEALKKEPLAFGSSYNEEKSLSEEEWRKRIKNVVFARSKDELIGMIVYVRNNKVKTGHITNIYGVYVVKEYRGQGVGKKLMDSVLEQIQKSGDVVKISLTVNPEQKAAVKLYQNYGFEVVGHLKKEIFVDGRFYDELIMEKLL
jgi:ribosomal protein S18 acetylase RimI-like enzyme